MATKPRIPLVYYCLAGVVLTIAVLTELFLLAAFWPL